ncbi:MAG TPA: hypothetical protein VHL58_17475 [Thermoanaerobaculia bacterium]|nr:hypothetical protein [Thermoanaerobaculia bacterium]
MPHLDDRSRSSLQEALASISSSLAAVDDQMFLMQLRLGETVLQRAVYELLEEVNPRTVKDTEFALNDLIGFVGELSDTDSGNLEPAFERLKSELLTIKSSAVLPNDLVARLTDLRGKLVTRRKAIDRDTYRDPGVAAEPLPHDPATLRKDAARLREELQRSGFGTPVMDKLVDGSEEFRMHDLSELIDEIDVITE